MSLLSYCLCPEPQCGAGRGGDVAAFRKDGYVVIPGFFSAHEIDQLRAELADMRTRAATLDGLLIYHESSLTQSGLSFPCRVENFLPYFPRFAAFCARPELLDAIRAVLGSEPVLFKDKIILKGPGGGGFRAHQDYNYGWSAFPTTFVNALISLDAATPQNGCIEFAPRSHFSPIGEKWWLLSDKEIAKREFVPIATEPGDLVLFDSLLVHRSADNLSDTHRSVLYLTFNRREDGDFRDDYYRFFPKIRRRFMLKQIEWIIAHNQRQAPADSGEKPAPTPATDGPPKVGNELRAGRRNAGG